MRDTFRPGHRPTPKHHRRSGGCWVASALFRGAATRQGVGRRLGSLWACRRVGRGQNRGEKGESAVLSHRPEVPCFHYCPDTGSDPPSVHGHSCGLEKAHSFDMFRFDNCSVSSIMVTNFHRSADLNHRSYFPPSPGGWTSQIKLSAGLTFPEASLCGCRLTASHLVRTGPFLRDHMSLVSPPKGTPALLDQRLTCMGSFYRDHLCRPVSKCGHVPRTWGGGIRPQHGESAC